MTKYTFKINDNNAISILLTWFIICTAFGIMFMSGCSVAVSSKGSVSYQITAPDNNGTTTGIYLPAIFGSPERDTSDSENFSSPTITRPIGH